MYDNIRISDADREQVTSRLREHFAEGRLTSDELDERITATLNAKTFGDLRGILADLPEPGPLGPQPGPLGPQPGPGWAFFAFIKLALLAWLVVCVAGIFAASRFRRRVRHSAHYGHPDPWRGWRP